MSIQKPSQKPQATKKLLSSNTSNPKNPPVKSSSGNSFEPTGVFTTNRDHPAERTIPKSENFNPKDRELD